MSLNRRLGMRELRWGYCDRMSADFSVMRDDALFHVIEWRCGPLPVPSNHVKGHLGIEHVFGQLLERQQVHRLLVKLVHALLPVFGRGLEDSCDHALDLARLPPSQCQQSHDNGSRMRHYRRARLQLWSLHLS